MFYKGVFINKYSEKESFYQNSQIIVFYEEDDMKNEVFINGTSCKICLQIILSCTKKSIEYITNYIKFLEKF